MSSIDVYLKEASKNTIDIFTIQFRSAQQQKVIRTVSIS